MSVFQVHHYLQLLLEGININENVNLSSSRSRSKSRSELDLELPTTITQHSKCFLSLITLIYLDPKITQ